jgi:hypothetical protein
MAQGPKHVGQYDYLLINGPVALDGVSEFKVNRATALMSSNCTIYFFNIVYIKVKR